MNDTILMQVYNVLTKYSKNYTRDGVLANLNAWNTHKRPLVDLLRKHPNWNEDALAVVFQVTQSREIDRYVVSPLKNSVFDLSAGMDLDGDDRANLCYSLDTAINPYAKLLPDEQVVAAIKQTSGVFCAVGQKTSRVVNKICQKYGVDQHPEYNARFAQLADSLNPMQVKRTALLSVHPCDFLEMSNENNSWNSCHCIRQGEYHAGTLSYMNDGVAMVFYTVDEYVSGVYYSEPKRTRQVFCYGDGFLLQSRLYPQTDDEEARGIYRDIVQRTLSHCLDVPNLWRLKRSQESVDQYCTTHSDALHYTDYTYKGFKPTVSLLKSVHRDDDRKITIGSAAYCVNCAYRLHSSDSLYCNDCAYEIDYITCEGCGSRIERDSDDGFYVSGDHYCRECVSWCEHCQEYTRDELTGVTCRQGYSISVCAYCCDEHYADCEDCGRYFHRDMGEWLDDGFHCHDCLDSRYFKCHHCDEYMRCEDADEIDGQFYCESCSQDARMEMENDETKCLATV